MKKYVVTVVAFLAVAAFGLAPLPIHAQQEAIGLRMDVDGHQVAVGDKLTVTIEFKQIGNGNASVVSGPSIPTPQHFEIRSQTSFTQVVMINQQSTMIYTTKLTLVATTPGNETLGPASLIYQDPAMKKREIKSNAVNVTVVEKSGFSLFGSKKTESTPTETPANPTSNPDELRGLKPLLPEVTNFIRIAFWTLVILLAIGLILWRFLRPGKPLSSAPVPMGVEAQFRDAWKKLGNEDLDAKEFCLGLSKLVRESLQYRYQFPAVNYTTEEILREMAKRKASDDEKSAIEKCLKSCDRVLHADGNLTGRENLRAMASAVLPKVPKS
ncbi:MAG TPA: BatD family protein [bacterium]|nr:BatD family protein [bacterium]